MFGGVPRQVSQPLPGQRHDRDDLRAGRQQVAGELLRSLVFAAVELLRSLVSAAAELLTC